MLIKVLVTQSGLTLCDPMDCSRQAPLSMGFSSQKYWSELPFPSPVSIKSPSLFPLIPKPWQPLIFYFGYFI